MTDTRIILPDLFTLIGLFYSDPGQLGQFEEVSAARMPQHDRMLLAHEHHMTVTVEKFHRCLVDVRVLATNLTEKLYARKILLTRQSDSRIVQFGIMRLNFALVSEQVRREVESQSKPLGRVLIENDVLREIHLVKLWRIIPGEELRRLFHLTDGRDVFGRTALIDCNGEPAVQLLEIVTPE